MTVAERSTAVSHVFSRAFHVGWLLALAVLHIVCRWSFCLCDVRVRASVVVPRISPPHSHLRTDTDASTGEHPGTLQATAACEEKNSSELDGRVIMVREDREDRDIKRGRNPSGRMQREGEPSGLQVRPTQCMTM